MTDKPELVQAAEAIGTKIGELAARMGLGKPVPAIPKPRKMVKQVKKKPAAKATSAKKAPAKKALAKKATVKSKVKAKTKRVAASRPTRKGTRRTG